jgi:hypothetical protein
MTRVDGATRVAMRDDAWAALEDEVLFFSGSRLHVLGADENGCWRHTESYHVGDVVRCVYRLALGRDYIVALTTVVGAGGVLCVRAWRRRPRANATRRGIGDGPTDDGVDGHNRATAYGVGGVDDMVHTNVSSTDVPRDVNWLHAPTYMHLCVEDDVAAFTVRRARTTCYFFNVRSARHIGTLECGVSCAAMVPGGLRARHFYYVVDGTTRCCAVGADCADDATDTIPTVQWAESGYAVHSRPESPAPSASPPPSPCDATVFRPLPCTRAGMLFAATNTRVLVGSGCDSAVYASTPASSAWRIVSARVDQDGYRVYIVRQSRADPSHIELQVYSVAAAASTVGC